MAADTEGGITEADTEISTARHLIVGRFQVIGTARIGIDQHLPHNSESLSAPVVALTTRRTAAFASIAASVLDYLRRFVQSAARRSRLTPNSVLRAVQQLQEQTRRERNLGFHGECHGRRRLSKRPNIQYDGSGAAQEQTLHCVDAHYYFYDYRGHRRAVDRKSCSNR